MDSNGLADPYVKLHLLPGASKVRFCQARCILGLGWSRGSSNPLRSLPPIRFSLLISPLAAVSPGGFSKQGGRSQMFSQTRGTAHPAGRNLLRDGGKLQRSITKHLPQSLIMARAGIIRLLGS